MDQKLAEILVTPLGDPDQPRLASGRYLPRYQAEPGSQVSSTRKALAMADQLTPSRSTRLYAAEQERADFSPPS